MNKSIPSLQGTRFNSSLPTQVVVFTLLSITLASILHHRLEPAKAILPASKDLTADTFVVSEPPAESTVHSVHHTRILSTFNAETYKLRYLGEQRPVASFVRQTHVLQPYQKSMKPSEVGATLGQTEPHASASTKLMFKFHSVGFPHIEISKRPAGERYKPFHALLRVINSDNGQKTVIPNVACYGYSAERTAKRAARFEQQISQLSDRYDISANLVKAVIAQESCFRIKATSPVGAQGLMQLMPETATWLGVTDIHNPQQNLRAGIKYLSQLKRRFGTTELALAAYNAGPGNVERYRGIPPFSETQAYVRKVLKHYQSYVASSQYSMLTISE